MISERIERATRLPLKRIVLHRASIALSPPFEFLSEVGQAGLDSFNRCGFWNVVTLTALGCTFIASPFHHRLLLQPVHFMVILGATFIEHPFSILSLAYELVSSCSPIL